MLTHRRTFAYPMHFCKVQLLEALAISCYGAAMRSRSLRAPVVPWLLVGIGAVAALLPQWLPGFRLPLPDRVQDGATVFLGVLLEALPFVLLGVLVSAGIRRYISPERMQRLLPRNKWLALPAAAALGLLFPVCECGNLPVARRLIRQGMRPAYAITFLLSAPILNPAVLISTIAAFRFVPELVVARFVLGFLVSVAVGAYFLLRGDEHVVTEQERAAACDHDHGGIAGILDELAEMLGTLSYGAALAAVIQVTIPRSSLVELGQNPVAAILVMMGLALIVSLCSNVDAFFALSFANTFSSSSLLAFLVFGPMIDFRAIALMTRVFTPRAIATIALLVAQLVFLGSLALHYLGIL